MYLSPLWLLPCLTAGAQSVSASPSDLHDLQQQVTALTARLDATGSLLTAVLLFFMASACLGLWWNARAFKAFRSVGLYLLSVATVFGVAYINPARQVPFLILTSLLLPEMAADVLGIPKGRWIWLNRVACIAALLFTWTPFLYLANRLTIDLSELFVLVLLAAGFRRGKPRERLIAAALAFIWLFRAPLEPFVRRFLPMSFRVGGWRWNFGPIAMVIFGAVAIAVFVRELMDDQREKERLAGELEAGRAMQQVLLGAELPAIPALQLESAYQPASEVGGDFFKALPDSDGGVLVIVGDVSGKGLRAAMTVSSILGALQMLPPAAPAQLLRALNRALAGKLQGGLVTCCIAQVARDGIVTAANAGHLSPYRNGEELVIESGLPLGIVADAQYSESTFALAPGDQLTFLSDGVVEAQSPTGELFGFDRTAAISTQSAEEIARAAQSFGQEDDITVLTLTFAPAEVLHA
ncbi:MAG: PP2C family protein-serine/threonine phosphatase [Terracidiphilus sp.]